MDYGRKKVGFVSMASEQKMIADIPEIGVGMIGYAFMGKAYSNAFKKMPYIFWPPAAIPRLITICGRHEASVAEAAVIAANESVIKGIPVEL